MIYPLVYLQFYSASLLVFISSSSSSSSIFNFVTMPTKCECVYYSSLPIFDILFPVVVVI